MRGRGYPGPAFFAEGLAMSVLEGWPHGLAVVATPVGAHAEVIEPDQSGLLVPPGDIAALGAALARVVGDRGMRERLRAGARQRFIERFDVRSYSDLIRLHCALLGDPRPLGGFDTKLRRGTPPYCAHGTPCRCRSVRSGQSYYYYTCAAGGRRSDPQVVLAPCHPPSYSNSLRHTEAERSVGDPADRRSEDVLGWPRF